MFYVYHIPKRRQWGCTNNLEKRIKKLKYRKGYTLNDVEQIITFTDIDEAADAERDLNLKYGYGWNSSRDYRVVITKAKAGGEAAAKVNTESKQIHQLGKTSMGAQASAKIIRVCPHCDKAVKGNTYFKWHGENCRYKQ